MYEAALPDGREGIDTVLNYLTSLNARRRRLFISNNGLDTYLAFCLHSGWRH